MGCGIGMANDRNHPGSDDPKPGDGGDGPGSVFGLHGLTVTQHGFDTGQRSVIGGIFIVQDDFDSGIQIGDGEGNPGDVVGNGFT